MFIKNKTLNKFIYFQEFPTTLKCISEADLSQGNSSKKLCVVPNKNFDNLEQVAQDPVFTVTQDPVYTYSSINSSGTVSTIECKNESPADTIEPINPDLPENSIVTTQTSTTITTSTSQAEYTKVIPRRNSTRRLQDSINFSKDITKIQEEDCAVRKNYYSQKIALYEKKLQLKADRNEILKQVADIEDKKLKSLEEGINLFSKFLENIENKNK